MEASSWKAAKNRECRIYKIQNIKKTCTKIDAKKVFKTIFQLRKNVQK